MENPYTYKKCQWRITSRPRISAQVLEYARAHSDQIKLHAGFIPRTYARKIMQGSIDEVLVEAKGKGYIAEDELCEGSDGHYSFFESLISRRDMHNPALIAMGH